MNFFFSTICSFNGSRAILSGPAGGVVGYAKTSYTNKAVIGFDMGGTSTDVSRYDGSYDHVFESVTAGITIQAPQVGYKVLQMISPSTREIIFYFNASSYKLLIILCYLQLDVNTVAAGGGSRLFFRSGMFVVGPESAGAHPGPVCYRNGGSLTVTDANLLLGRLLPEFFPCIFGPTEDQPLDKESTVAAFEKLAEEVSG